MDPSSPPLRNISKYRFLLHGFLMGSIIVPLYLFINYFLNMIYAPTHELSGISFEASTLFFIQRKFDKLIIPSIFTSFYI
jgi:uncharacterized metal-binding protein